MVPGVYEKGLTGAVVVYDCQMSSSERLVLSFARSAHQAGAELANYVEATELLIKAGRVTGAQGRDILTGNELAIRAKIVVNASGPWIEHVLSGLQGHNLWQRMSLSKAFNLLINRQLIANYAVGVYSRGGFRDGDAILDKGSRLLFINPWHNRSLIGTAHLPYRGDPDQFQLTEAEIGAFLNEINEAYPRADLKLKDISRVYAGLLPAVENNSGGVQLARQHQIYDHQADGVDGLISVSGVKFTEARYVAERVVDQVFSKLGKKPTNSTTAVTAVYGGCIEQLNDFTIHETEKRPRELSPEAISLLIRHYGSAYSNVLKYLPDEDPINDSAGFIKAEVLYGIREEMAQKLTDIIFRRTTLAIPGNLTEISLKTCLGIMEKELGWNEQRIQRETEELCCAPFTAITRTEEAA
jgi:glycerol-3-phosphate dehydrogenase